MVPPGRRWSPPISLDRQRRQPARILTITVVMLGTLAGALPVSAQDEPTAVTAPDPAVEIESAPATCSSSDAPFEQAVAEARSLRAAPAVERDAARLREAASRLEATGRLACGDVADWLPVLERERVTLLRLAATVEADPVALDTAVSNLDQALLNQKGIGAAVVENELGLAKRLLGDARHDVGLYLEAVSHYRRALAAFEDARDDANAGTVRWNLAVALLALGEARGEQAHLEEAAALFAAVLPALDRRESPRDWSIAQAELGQTLLTLGEARNDLDILRRAVSALEAALEDAQSDGRSLEEWAETQNALANALQALGEREWSMERLEAALKARRNAGVLYESAGLQSYQYYFATRIAALEKLIELRKREPIVTGMTGENGAGTRAAAAP